MTNVLDWVYSFFTYEQDFWISDYKVFQHYYSRSDLHGPRRLTLDDYNLYGRCDIQPFRWKDSILYLSVPDKVISKNTNAPIRTPFGNWPDCNYTMYAIAINIMNVMNRDRTTHIGIQHMTPVDEKTNWIFFEKKYALTELILEHFNNEKNIRQKKFGEGIRIPSSESFAITSLQKYL